MKRGYWVALVLAGGIWATSKVGAQDPAGGGAGSSQTGQSQKPAGAQPQQAVRPAETNPFPEDTSNVPVMPSNGPPALPAETDSGSDDRAFPMAGGDNDPVRSPDDPVPTSSSQGQESSSLAGSDRWQPPADDDDTDKKSGRRRMTVKETTHQESAVEDINVGGYYLDKKNWGAALSRFQSAMVLDPENPDVYWGLAEAARHLGDFTEARGYYQKVVDYDPDSKHGKEASKALKEPEIANARNAAPGQPPADATK
jgi:tetratricopeptide (TPR) repeat protein